MIIISHFEITVPNIKYLKSRAYRYLHTRVQCVNLQTTTTTEQFVLTNNLLDRSNIYNGLSEYKTREYLIIFIVVNLTRVGPDLFKQR